MHPPWWLLAALAAALAPPSADAWTPKLAPAASAKSTFGPSSSTRLFSTPDPAPSSGDPNSVYRTFINQCSVQSFMFLLKTTRDPYSIRWLDNFTMPAIRPGGRDHQPQPVTAPEAQGGAALDDPEASLMDQNVASELLRYHGLGAMNTTAFPTWDAYFGELLKRRDETLVIETWDPRCPEFDVEISPASLCSRILSIREQICREFAEDLDKISRMGAQIYAQYWDEVRTERERRQAAREAAAAPEEGGRGDPGEGGGKARSPGAGGEAGRQERVEAGFARQSLIFLEWDPNFGEDSRPSPLRTGNFDLLVLLVTQEAVNRLLARGVEGDNPEEERESTEFLRDFYYGRVVSHFTGQQRYRRADDFLEELMLSPPRVKDTGRGAYVLVDPLNIAELLLITRDAVAAEWAQIAREAPQEHVEIRRLQLDRMMGK